MKATCEGSDDERWISVFLESYMNVSQYSPNRQLEREAIGSIDALPSVKEVLRDNQQPSDGVDRESGNPTMRTGVLEANGARFEYSIDARGHCAIDRCSTQEVCLSVPEEIEGHPVVAIGGHSFSTCYQLADIQLPSCIEEIREHAFMNTALTRFESPANLRLIGAKAFYRCEKLQSLLLGESVRVIGEGAFRESSLVSLDIPAGVSDIGRDAFKGTPLVFSGEGQTLGISEDNESFGLLDGALYRGGADGLTLVQLLDDELAEYEGPCGLAHVSERAFAGCRFLRSVELPEGTTSIGDAAFKGCAALARITLPDSIVSIGRQAFRQTALESLRIPRDLEAVGAEAFYTGGSVARDFRQTIRSVEVAPGNERFYIEEETLCQRNADGAIALLHFGTSPHIVVPRSVTEVGPYAFLNSRHATCVTMHDRIGNIDVGGLDFGRALSTVVFETSGESAERYVIEYPPGDASSQMARITFGGREFDVEFAYAEADRAILHAQDLFTRARMMLDRLMNPVHLGARAEMLFRSRLKTTVPSVCVEFGLNGYLEGIDYLLELGFLDEGNVQESIDAAIEADEVAVVSRLVEIKRTRFEIPLFDWDL